MILKILFYCFDKNFILIFLKRDNERVIIEANHGVNIKLKPIRNGRINLTIP